MGKKNQQRGVIYINLLSLQYNRHLWQWSYDDCNALLLPTTVLRPLAIKLGHFLNNLFCLYLSNG